MNTGMQSPRQYRGGYAALPLQEQKKGADVPSLALAREPTPVTDRSSLGMGPLDTVQFSSAIYIVNVDEGKLVADIMRIGKMEEEVRFNYSTTSHSAVAGKQFEPVSGTITMGPREDSAIIEVPILNS